MEGGVQNSWKGLKYFCGVLTCKIFEMVDVLNFLIRKMEGGWQKVWFGGCRYFLGVVTCKNLDIGECF